MVSLHDLTFSYKRNEPVLEHLNLRLEPGRIYGLLGQNGAGKSTLLCQMAGLLFPDSGTCRVEGYDPARRDPDFLGSVYLVPDAFHLPDLSSSGYVNLYAAFYPKFEKEVCASILRQFNIPEDCRLASLSYGQQKKFLIAFAVASGVKLLLLDEPTNGLDIPSKQQFRKVIAGHMGEDQVIVISSHQVRDLDSLIDSVLILHDHRIILQAPVEKITDRLVFRKVKDRAEKGAPLYAEEALGGYAVITTNPEVETSRLDMELLFNAAISGNESIITILAD